MSLEEWTSGGYPFTRSSDHVDIYQSQANGEVHVSDPYHWMEQTSEEVENWMRDQTAFAKVYLDQFQDSQRLETNFRSVLDYPKFSAPTLLDDGHWVWFFNSGLRPQAVLYRSKEAVRPDFSKDDDEIGDVFFDPNVLAADGGAVVLNCRFSPCGKLFSYAISQLGGDFVTIYVRSTSAPLSQDSTAEGQDGRLPDEVKWSKFNAAIVWSKDSKGFLYQRYPARQLNSETENDQNAMMCYHRIGTPQSEDLIVHQDANNPDWIYETNTSEDGKYLYLYLHRDTSKKKLLWVAELDEGRIGPGQQWNKVVDAFVAYYSVISNRGTLLYVTTNLDAPQHKVITIDLSKREPEFRDFIPEMKDAKLVQVNCVNNDYFAVIYKRNVKDEIYLYSKDGSQLARLASDFVGSASIANREKQPHFFLTFSGFTTPGSIFCYDFTLPDEHRYSLLRTTKVQGLNLDDFVATQVWYNGHDETKIPMFIVRHKSTNFDGTAAAIQYGYGGFGVTSNPVFSPIILSFMQMYGAIFALPNVRGGGEFGEAWHKGGSRENKANSFDDFISAAQFLVRNKYVAPGKVAINGVSNGGLLICGSLVRAPEGTFGAAVPEGSVADLLRYHKFTGGKIWASEYGDPGLPDEFDFVYSVSPVHNVPKNKTLPPTLAMINAGDDRVVPMHTLKFVATLQNNLPHNANPLLLHVDSSWTGHGEGKPTDRHIKDAVLKWGFIAQAMGLSRRDSD